MDILNDINDVYNINKTDKIDNKIDKKKNLK